LQKKKWEKPNPFPCVKKTRGLKNVQERLGPHTRRKKWGGEKMGELKTRGDWKGARSGRRPATLTSEFAEITPNS